MAVEIKRVETKKDLKRFINFHYDLYQGNAYDAPSLFLDDWNTLRKDKNAAFEFCEADYYLALKEGKVVGRVAAIINKRANEKWQRKSVRFGWIDFIDDIEVSAALLKAVEDYGRQKGMTEIVGPLGFTDMDPEGMLTWGFDQLGTMATIYNYPYYPEHMEKLGGFEPDNDYVEFKLIVPDQIPEKYAKVAQVVESRYNLRIIKFRKKDVYDGGYGLKMFQLINESFKDLYGYSEMTDRQIIQYLKMWLPLVNYDFVTGIVDANKDNELVGIGITIPSMTRALQKCHRGRLLPFGWWHAIRALKFGKSDIIDLMLIAIKPEYRSKGANALMFTDLIPRYIKAGIKWGESQVEMKTNEKVQSQWGPLNPIHHKSRRCYRKEIKY
ncbi:MAG: N-acetyltransferase [Prevotella sp.]|nr:N-acetyltransferase [Prevotella sp.]